MGQTVGFDRTAGVSRTACRVQVDPRINRNRVPSRYSLYCEQDLATTFTALAFSVSKSPGMPLPEALLTTPVTRSR